MRGNYHALPDTDSITADVDTPVPCPLLWSPRLRLLLCLLSLTVWLSYFLFVYDIGAVLEPFLSAEQAAIASSIDEASKSTIPTLHHLVEYGLATRRLHQQVWNLYHAVESRGERDKSRALPALLSQLISYLAEFSNFTTQVDRVDEWHRQELSTLGIGIQHRLHKMQHPDNCTRILLAELDMDCGFGCQLHHLTHALFLAAASNRTLVMVGEGRKWRYSSSRGWLFAFEPITNCSYHAALDSAGVKMNEAEAWTGPEQPAKVVRLMKQHAEPKGEPPPQMPLNLPQGITEQLQLHHTNPSAFLMGQFKHYLLGWNRKMGGRLTEAEKKVPFNEGPIVGVLIQRTELLNYTVEEYMHWVELWYRVQERRLNLTNAFRHHWTGTGKPSILPRRIYLVTDDPKAVSELRFKYAHYEIYPKGPLSTRDPLSGYNEDGLMSVLTDIHLLTRCSHLVCAFSDEFCRIAYELMWVCQGDRGAESAYYSLDFDYFHTWQHPHEYIEVEAHDPVGEWP